MNDRFDEDLKRAYTLLESAKKERKGDYSVYNAYKNQIDSLLLSSEIYCDMIKRLCKILEI